MANFKPGDTVFVLPYDEIIGKGQGTKYMPSRCYFPDVMKQYCEKTFTIKALITERPLGGIKIGYYQLKGAGGWSFTDEMLESAMPKLDPEIKLSFEDLMNWN